MFNHSRSSRDNWGQIFYSIYGMKGCFLHISEKTSWSISYQKLYYVLCISISILVWKVSLRIQWRYTLKAVCLTRIHINSLYLIQPCLNYSYCVHTVKHGFLNSWIDLFISSSEMRSGVLQGCQWSLHGPVCALPVQWSGWRVWWEDREVPGKNHRPPDNTQLMN